MFVRYGIPSKEVKANFFLSDIECLVIKFNIKKAK